MHEGLNASERFVSQICANSFLSLWSISNPVGKNRGKELCDYLVSCGDDVIIFSVKEIGLAKSAQNSPMAVDRWRRKAIDASVRQVYGAERQLSKMTVVTNRKGSKSLIVAPLGSRRYHRVGVACGSEGKAPLEFGDFGKGFVHIFDERSAAIIIQELDTIQDFISYLCAKEELIEQRKVKILMGGEEDLLAFYLRGNRCFPQNHDMILLDGTLWEGHVVSEDYKFKKREDKVSYTWDCIIDYIGADILKGDLHYCSDVKEAELAMRHLAMENRFNRRLLSEAFEAFMQPSNKIRARMTQSNSGVVYVFLALERTDDRQLRVSELGMRCFIARGRFDSSGCKTVVGIATERVDGKRGLSFDVICLYLPEWSAEDSQEAERLSKEFKFFSSPNISHVSREEYGRC